jgi:hypothetical protein
MTAETKAEIVRMNQGDGNGDFLLTVEDAKTRREIAVMVRAALRAQGVKRFRLRPLGVAAEQLLRTAMLDAGEF